MDGHLWLLVILFLVFLVLSAFFSATESAFSSMNVIRVKSRAEDGDKRAKSAILITEHFDRALTTLLVGNNLVNVAAAAITTLIAAKLFPESEIATFLCAAVTTVIIFLFSEMIPKSLAYDRSEELAMFASPILIFLMKVLRPVSALFMKISGAVTKFFQKNKQPIISEDELYDIIDVIEEEGVVDEDQSDLLKSALDFDDTTAADVMTVRADMVTIDISLSTPEILSLVQNSNHTRIPVYEGDPDHIIGILQIRNFLKEYLKNPNLNVRSLLLDPYFVSPGAKIDDLLAVMRQHRSYLAIVANEEHNTLGIVTIEDFLEELVGEIWDEDDIYDKNFIKLGGNRFQVNPHMAVKDAFRRIGITIPAAGARQSLASWIKQYYLRIRGTAPEEDDVFQYENVEIEVLAVSEGRVTEVVLHNLNADIAGSTSDREVV